MGGYIPGPQGFDSLIVGYYRGKDLVYVARVRNGFVPASRRQVFEKIRHLVSPTMPFVNLPDTQIDSSRMRRSEFRWLERLSHRRPRVQAPVAPANSCRLRHSGPGELLCCGKAKTSRLLTTRISQHKGVYLRESRWSIASSTG
jgi:hypothetical protein